MRRTVNRAMLLILMTFTLISASSCGWLADLVGASLFSVSGTAVNVSAPSTASEYWKGTTDTSKTLVGATITLTNVYDATQTVTATVGSNGTWTALNVAAGKYRITGTASGWTFLPKEIEITGILQSAEPILAFETPADTSEIFIVVEWQRPTSINAIDVDSILVVDLGNNGAESAVFSSAFDYGVSSEYDVPTRYTGSALSQDRDVFSATDLSYTATTPLVETIRIKSNPFGTADGELRYFLNAYDSATLTGDSFGTTPIASTYATVTVMQAASTSTDGLLGIFNIALDSYEKMLGVVKVDVDYNGGTTTYTVMSYGNETPIGGLPTAKDL